VSKPSNWPLTEKAVRFILPTRLSVVLAKHPVSEELFVECMGFYPSAKNHSMKREKHGDWLILYCIDGKALVGAYEQSYPVRAGDLVVLPSGLPHSYRADRKKPWSIYWVHFSGKKAHAYMDHLVSLKEGPVVPIGVRTKLISDFRELIEIGAVDRGYSVPAFLYAANLLKQMLSYMMLIQQELDHRQTGSFDIEQIHSLMEKAIDGHLTLEDLAASVKLSRYHFAKRYKQLTGVPPMAHFLNVKMKRACYLLDMEKKSIAEIARMLGYEDPYYFSRVFKKATGHSPREYRKLNKG